MIEAGIARLIGKIIFDGISRTNLNTLPAVGAFGRVYNGKIINHIYGLHRTGLGALHTGNTTDGTNLTDNIPLVVGAASDMYPVIGRKNLYYLLGAVDYTETAGCTFILINYRQGVTIHMYGVEGTDSTACPKTYTAIITRPWAPHH